VIILGNKNRITNEDKKTITSKVGLIHYVDITHHTDEDIVQDIKRYIEEKKVEFLVLNLDKYLSTKLKSYLEELEYDGVEIMIYAEFAHKFLNEEYVNFNEKNLDVYRSIHHNELTQVLKRVFDFHFALLALLFLTPFIVIIAFFIKLKSPEGGVFFTQQRLGRNGRFFRVFKFRTMVPNAEKKLKIMLEENPEVKKEYLKYRKLKEDPRIIPGIGHFIRKTSLDELPQFMNVLLGSMSVVGPRPYIQDEFCNHDQRFVDVILSVRPGVTGFWQVGDRSEGTFNERVLSDIQYITEQTFIGDIKIIIKTVTSMLSSKGI